MGPAAVLLTLAPTLASVALLASETFRRTLELTAAASVAQLLAVFPTAAAAGAGAETAGLPRDATATLSMGGVSLDSTAQLSLECAGVGLAAAMCMAGIARTVSRRGSVYKQSKSLQSFAAAAAASAALGFRRPDLFFWFTNPLGLGGLGWAALLVAKCAALSLLDTIVLTAVRRCVQPKRLEYREQHPGVKGLVSLEWIDYIYLGVNQVIEYIFALHVIRFALESDGMVTYHWSDVGILNTAVALYLIFVIDDLIYAPSHLFMHWAPVYPYIHKHHHRQIVPKRGYTDAGNEHPLEQVIGLSIVWITLQVVGRLTGLHVSTVLCHFVLYAALALLNHTDMDIRFKVLGFDYSVGAHEMHHRVPSCNMAQYWMHLDRLFGTYRDYTPPPKQD